ncbi:hypothetical protein L7F22_024172 [Adiantum nelumboides]|nr:hypothetical protein [Adiantum nelumboides]
MVLLWLKNIDLMDEKNANLMVLLWLKNVDLMDEKNVDMMDEKNVDLMVLLWLKNADLMDEKNADLMVLLWLKNADLKDEKNADLMEYNANFCDALLPMSSYKIVPLAEQIEKYRCGLPKGIKKYCTKTSVMNIAQLMENAEVDDDLIQGKPDVDGSRTHRHFANECPQRNSKDKDNKFDRKGKKPKPSAGLVPNLVWLVLVIWSLLLLSWESSVYTFRAVREKEMLIFFDPRARANFISPELASKLGMHAEEMGMTREAGLACLGHLEPVTPILGKLRLHLQSYVDAKEFHIMPLQDCDVLLGIPWCYRLHVVVDIFHKKITLVHRGKTHVLDVKLKRESVPIVSTSAISSVIKNNLSAYLIFAKEVHEIEFNFSKLEKDRTAFLNGFSDCFSNSLPDELPPKRPEDHSIDLVPGSSPPNRPSYRVSAAQQKDIMS